MKKNVFISIIVCFFTLYSTLTGFAATLTPIMGESECTPEQMYVYLLENNDKNGLNPISEEYAKDFVLKVDQAAKSEGVRSDVAFALMMHETGFLNFGGDVLSVQNNFGGLGATGKGAKGTYFDNVEDGVLAVVQHLKCYASTEKLNNKNVDPRYSEKLRATAAYVEYLGKADNPSGVGWAVPGKGYGERIVSHINRIKAIDTNISFSTEKKAPMKELFIILCLVAVLVVLMAVRSNVQKSRKNKKHTSKNTY